MYPIDAIKVCKISSCAMYRINVTDFGADSHANPKSYPFGSLQWNDTRRIQNCCWRRHFKLMERHVQCDCWRRLVSSCKKAGRWGKHLSV